MMKNKWLMVFIMVFLLSMTACGNGNQAEDGKKNATVEQKDSVALEKESGKLCPKTERYWLLILLWQKTAM